MGKMDLSKSLVEDLQAMKRQVENDFPAVLIIDGNTGTGKTTLAVRCADIIQGRPIDLKKQIGLGSKDFRQKLIQAYKEGLKVMIFDEAGEFNKRRAMSKENVNLVMLFEMARAFKIPMILCLPFVGVLDNSFKNHDVIFGLIHIFSRDIDLKKAAFGAYDRRAFGRLLHYIFENPQIQKQDAYKRIFPNYTGLFRDLSADRAAELRIISITNKIRAVEQMDEKTEVTVQSQKVDIDSLLREEVK